MINEKLKVLLKSGVIDEETNAYVRDVLQYLLKNNIISSEDQADIFLTHLAMAHMRQKEDDAVSQMDDIIKSEIENNERYEESQQLWKIIDNMSELQFGESELHYFYLHIINMLKEE